MRETLPWGGHAIYDRLVATRLERFYQRVARMQPPSGSILDIGCGPGTLTRAMHRLRPDAHVIGVDLDPRQVKRAQHHAPDVDFRAGDSRELAFKNNTFDRIVTTESFHHWGDQAQALEEMFRVLKPGGEFWIIEGAGDMSRDELARWSEKRPWPGALLIARLVFRTHGYTTQAINEQVLPLLEASPFRGCLRERLDGWWILRLRKPR